MKQIIFATVFISGLLVIFFGLNCSNHSPDQTDVALVNEESISKQEFELIVNKNRNDVIDYFTNKYNVQYDKNFWTTDLDGEQPAEFLKEKALHECVRIKIQQMLARDKGIVRDISYSALLDEMNKENKKRKQAVQSKRIIYEPLEFDEQNFLYYQLDKIIFEIKAVFVGDIFDVSESNLKQFYDNNKDDLFKEKEFIKIRQISISVKNEEKKKFAERYADAKNDLNQVKRALETDRDSSELLSRDNVVIQDFVFDESTPFIDEKINYKLIQTALGLKPGKISEIIEHETGPFIIKCLTRQEGQYFPYEQVTEIVRANYIDYCYNKFIDEQIKNAGIKINKSVYQSVVIPI